MTSQIPDAVDAAQTNAFCTMLDGQGDIAPGASLTFALVSVPDQAGVSYDRTPFSAVADSNGLLQVPLLRNATYKAHRGGGRSVTFSTSSAPTFELPDILGR